MDFNDLDGLDVDAINIHDVLGDPELLAELHNLGWNDHHQPPVPPPITTDIRERPAASRENENISSTSSLAELPPDLDDSNIKLEDADFNDPELIKMYELLSGNGSDTHPSLNTVQSIPSIVAAPPMKPSAPSKPLPVPTQNVTIPQPAASSPVPPNKVSNGNVSSTSANSVTAEEAKRKAIEAKRAGNTEEALYWFRISKQQQQPVTPSNTPSISNKDIIQNKTNNPMISASSVLQNFDPNFTSLEAALMEASRTSLAAAKAMRETEPQQAVLHMRDYKRYEQDLATLKVRRTIPGAHPPAFRWAVTQKKISLERLELGEDELRVLVEGVYEIDALVKEHKVKDIWAEISVGSAGKESELGSQRTSTVKFDATSKCAVWKFQTSFPVIKRSKISQATQLRKRVTVKIVGQKAGILWSNTVDLAVASVSFADLAAVCECGGRTPLFQVTQGEDGGMKKGKAVGGYLMLTLQVRKPLSGAETRIVEERQLLLEQWPPLPTTTPPPPPSKFAADLPPVHMNSESASSATANASQTSAVNYGANLTDREKMDPESVDFLESNDVLEAEITAVQQQIQSGHLDEDAMFNATLRLQLLQVKLQTLVLRVQNETLSLDDYLQLLRDRVQRDKQMALYFSKTVGDAEAKDVAVRILRRMKIMQQEIDNAAAAAEEEPEEAK